MGKVINNINDVMEHIDVDAVCRNLPDEALGLMYSFGHSKNFETMIGMPDIFINLIKYINTNTEIFDVNTYYGDICFVLNNILNILESDKFINGIISIEYIYRVIDKLSEAIDNNLFGIDNSFVYFFDLICNPKFSLTESDLNELYDSLGHEKMLINICFVLIENVKKDDKETDEAVWDYIDEHDFETETYGKISSLYISLFKMYVEKEINKDRLNSIINLINNFHNDCKKNMDEIALYVYKLNDVLASENFKKGIIPDTYIEEYFKCNYEEQLRTMKNLLTCEYYELGFITKEHIEIVSNSKEYIFITCMLDYILTGKVPVKGNKYDVALGILNFDRKKELCDELYSHLQVDNDIKEFNRVALNYLQYNLFFPKFEVKPFTRERVLESGN